ncbi:GNAT family N-acetyltransferase [Nocardioides sp. TF02-7]|uniref:GNAT family N-acetyltransferase n=1 Tax=Nocardioides sp. TF02-7 TaxID=2917724 RepID=UPI001F057CE8|nr:GNAT family N-acetyltransferase [Nocardioides sp. TF02-7]UMG91827.1 GNAT family N-acetyltransferase [Nocardioides sp. TF02-7]
MQDWHDLAALLGPGGLADMFSSPATPPPDWAPVFTVTGLQLVGPEDPQSTVAPPRAERSDVRRLGPEDVPDMLDLVASTAPGPFWPRTIEMGTYLGVREGGRLVAIGGVRVRPEGWSEISAVCTAHEARGRGLAGQVVGALVDEIHRTGDRPFLHVLSGNTGALALYERLGFSVRREVVFRGFRVPG